MKIDPLHASRVGAFLSFILLTGGGLSEAAVFPTTVAASDNARIEVTDSTGSLGWNPPAITPTPNALTVMAWVKISLPSNTTLSENMTVLANRRTSDWNQPYAYRFYFNISTGNLEFTARGTSVLTPIILVPHPYLDRWYHLAVVRNGTTYTPYVDGRSMQSWSQDIGNAANTDGLSVGGFKGGEKFWGEVQEVAVFQQALTRSTISTQMFKDIAAASFPKMTGYYKLGYSATPADNLKNFAASPATGTNPATKAGTGTIDFPETDKQGEQSLFDTMKNAGRDATAPLAGAFSWQRAVFTRPTAGIPLELKLGYNSGISFNSQQLEGGGNMYSDDAVLGSGWRHSFQTRLIPGNLFNASSPASLVGLLLWDGTLETWQRQTGGIYKTTHGEYRGELRDNPADPDTMLWITPDRLVYVFYDPSTIDPPLTGLLKEIRDFNGNRVVLNYDSDLGRLNTVTDTGGGVWTFNYNAQNQLVNVTGLGWTVSFTFNGDGRLATFSHTGPAAYLSSPALSTTWTFNYNTPGLLSGVTTPRGTTNISVAYDTYGRKITETDGAGRTMNYRYGDPGPRQISRTDGDGKIWTETFDRKGHVVAKRDPLGATNSYEYDATTGVMTQLTEPLGWITTYGYDSRSNMITKTDALGQVWRWVFPQTTDPAGTTNGHLNDGNGLTSLLNRPVKDIRPRVAGETSDWENRYIYDTKGNLLRQEDDLGPLAVYGYDSRGLVTSAMDGNLHEKKTTYDAVTGFPLTSTDPANKTTAFGTTELGWHQTVTDPLAHTTTFEFDINGNVVRTTDAIGRVIRNTYDETGNLRFSYDAKNQPSEFRYDSSNLRNWSSDRAGNIMDFSFNGRSLPYQTTTPSVPVSQASGAPQMQRLVTTNIYDDAGRILRVTDPAGDYVEHTYDLNGNETATRDKLGKIWHKQYDSLNRVVVVIDPLGNTRGTIFDEAGRVKSTTDANGNTSTNAYDGRGRLHQWTDPAGGVWIYSYDGTGNILDIEDALHGHYVMTYDARNLRLTEKNQDNLQWTYTYDENGRLKTQAEPSGLSRSLYYDPIGRLQMVSFSTGRMGFMDYDANGNLESAVRMDMSLSTSTQTTTSYDALDRLTRTTDTFGQSVAYSYDAIGRVTTLSYPGSKTLGQEYDLRSRLVRQALWGGQTITYAWDKEGRLASQTYPNGIVRSAGYDDAGHLVALGYADGKGTADTGDDTVMIAMTYAYDRNGNQTSASDKGLLVPTPPAAKDETAAYSAAGRIQSRIDAAVPTGANNWTYEFKNANGSPSMNLSRATGAGYDLALTYDEDNRTTGLTVTDSHAPPSVTHTVTNMYDPLGRRVARTMDGTQTRYILNLVGGMERILADADSSNHLTAYYVHGPDLAVRIDPADPTKLACYHADASGNIVRLTDQTKATVAEYAYSDYGKQLASNSPSGTDTNPYRFVGSQGVMDETIVPGLYFMRARYYLADPGVFLAVDPVKNIGPGWKPMEYGYAGGNPVANIDPNGQVFLPAMAIGSLTSVISTTAVMNFEMVQYLMSDGAIGKTYSYEEITSKVVGSAVSGALEGAVGGKGIGKLLAGAAASSVGVMAERGVGSVIGVEYDESLVGALAEDWMEYALSQSIPDVAGAKGGITWTSKAFSHGIAEIGKGVVVGMTNSTLKQAGTIVAAGYAQTANKASTSISSSISSPLPRATATTTASSAGATGGGGSSYTIKSGDTLSAIAARSGTTVTALATANGISNVNLIYAGAKISIPSKPSTGSSSSGKATTGKK